MKVAAAARMSEMLPENSENYQHLDQENFRKIYTRCEEPHMMHFYIRGIRCAKCVRKLEDLSGQVDGLKSVRIQMGLNLADVEIIPSAGSFAKVASAMQALGFEPVPIRSSENPQDIIKKEDRTEIIRLGVSAACTMNIMTFAFAAYFGVTGELERIFAWISFALYLPILLYCAVPFYKGCWNSIKQRQLSIDGPIAIASLSGFTWSTVNLLRADKAIYFDSLASFLTLILFTRFVQKRLQRSFLKFELSRSLVESGRVRLVSSKVEGFRAIPVEDLKVGDEISLQQNEVLPADGILVSDSVVLDLSFLTGESNPRRYSHGMRIPAGAVVLQGNMRMTVEAVGDQTSFGKILSSLQKSIFDKVRALSISDKAAQILLMTVFAVAGIFILAYWRVSPQVALERALALIILACPCAMAFGTPLALSFSLRKAGKLGLMIKNADIFESVLKASTVFLDKTGTVTKSRMKVHQVVPANISEENIKLILAMESISVHPIAFAIRDHWATFSGELSQVTALLTEHNEVTGVGVHAIFAGKKYELKRSPEAETMGLREVALLENNVVKVRITFEDLVHPKSKEVIEHLKQMGKKVVILSGDQSEIVTRLGAELGIERENCFGGLTPEQKAQIVRATPDSIMVGDGMNDIIALKEASVGIAVNGSVETALKSADAFAGKPGIEFLPGLIQVSESAFSLIKQNLTISAIYNLVGGVAALMGFVNPFVAAIMMPISSGFILLSSWIGSRK